MNEEETSVETFPSKKSLAALDLGGEIIQDDQSPDEQNYQAVRKEIKKKENPNPLLILGIILLCVLILYMVYYLFKETFKSSPFEEKIISEIYDKEMDE